MILKGVFNENISNLGVFIIRGVYKRGSFLLGVSIIGVYYRVCLLKSVSVIGALLKGISVIGVVHYKRGCLLQGMPIKGDVYFDYRDVHYIKVMIGGVY